MSFNTDWDVSKYRSPHEPNYQWQLKKKFMELNKDRLPEDRLACLAQTFANIEFMGCRYPKVTTDLVDQLSFGVIQEFRESRKNILKRTFVSGSDAAESKVNRKGTKRKSDANETVPSSLAASRMKYGRFVPASASSEQDRAPSPSPTTTIKQAPTAATSKAELGVITPVTATTETSSTTAVAATTIVISPAKATGTDAASSEKSSNSASKRKPIVWDIQDDSKTKKQPKQQPQQQQQGNKNLPKQNFKINWNDPLSEFVVVRMLTKPDEPVSNILARSAGFSKMSQITNYKELNNGKIRCDIVVNDQIVGTSVSDRRNDARDDAQDLALQNLSRRCYTLLIKNKFASEGGTLVDIDDLSAFSKSDDSLTSNNIGHKLLQMMGWSGGGLGKEGDGISEPITAQAVFNRQGLGSSNTDKDFKGKIRKIIQDYAQSGNTFDLVFSTGFTNEQRKEMHDIARRLGLKSKSFGKNEDRFLTISRRQNSRDIIRNLISRGGSSEKYELLAPNSNRF